MRRRRAPEIGKNFLAQQFFDIPGSVDDSQNFDSVLERPIKYQISLEALDPPHSYGGKFRIPKHPGGACLWHLGQFLESKVGGLKESAGNIEAGILAKENKVGN